MAYQYDEFGNIVGEYESEEERRQREQQDLADTAIHTQEIKTYGDGTKEVVTKQEIPPELQRQQAQYKQTVAQVQAPVSPEQMAYTKQQESGGRSDIGYHFPANAQGQRQSTAFGPYGITAPAYKDIVRQDPSLNKPITEWTPEEHDKAYNVLVGRNQARLTQLGIEPTGGALQLSHLLGPDGAAKFLKTGQVSEAAARANGGAERLKQIAEGRFAGAPSASSGAVTRPPQAQPQPGVAVATGQGVQGTMETPVSPEDLARQEQYSLAQPAVVAPQVDQTKAAIDAYQQVQDDPASLFKLSQDPNAPEWMKERARNRAADLVTQQREEARTQKELGTLDENGIAKILRERRGEGSRLKGALFAALGLKDLANEEAYKLGIGIDKADMIGDQPVIIKVAANGKAIDGINAATGQELSAKDIAMYNSGLAGKLGKGASVSAEVYVDQKTGQRYRSGVDSQGNAALVNIQGGAPFKGNPKDLQVQSIGTAAAKAEATNAIELRYTGPKAYTKAGAAFAGKFNAENGTNIGYATETPGAPLIDLNTGKTIVPDANGNITATKVGGGTVTQAAPAQAQPAQAAANVPLDKLPKAPTMEPGESPSAFAARTKAWSETYGKQYEALEKNTKAAKDLFPYVTEMKKLIDQSTSSGFGAIVDSAGNFVGYSTPGATAIAAIAPLANKVLMGVERFEGPQSDKDVASYKEASGKLADPNVPAAQKQAAFNTIIEIMKRNAPDLDWNSVSGVKANAGTTASGNKFKKVGG